MAKAQTPVNTTVSEVVNKEFYLVFNNDSKKIIIAKKRNNFSEKTPAITCGHLSNTFLVQFDTIVEMKEYILSNSLILAPAKNFDLFR